MHVNSSRTHTVITSGPRTGINIEVNGNVEKIKVDSCDLLTVNGTVTSVKSQYGSVRCGDVLGDVEAEFGSVRCGKVSGSVKAQFGSIRHIKM